MVALEPAGHARAARALRWRRLAGHLIAGSAAEAVPARLLGQRRHRSKRLGILKAPRRGRAGHIVTVLRAAAAARLGVSPAVLKRRHLGGVPWALGVADGQDGEAEPRRAWRQPIVGGRVPAGGGCGVPPPAKIL